MADKEDVIAFLKRKPPALLPFQRELLEQVASGKRLVLVYPRRPPWLRLQQRIMALWQPDAGQTPPREPESQPDP